MSSKTRNMTARFTPGVWSKRMNGVGFVPAVARTALSVTGTPAMMGMYVTTMWITMGMSMKNSLPQTRA